MEVSGIALLLDIKPNRFGGGVNPAPMGAWLAALLLSNI